MKRKTVNPLYWPVCGLVWLFSPKMRVEGAENLPTEPAVVVANHCQMYGPIAGEFYGPKKKRIWCAAQMMTWREVPGYAFEDFWSKKPRSVRWFYKLLSYLITPLAVLIFNNAHTLPVYRDTRIIGTFRRSVESLREGESLVIFPEHDAAGNGILWEFQDRFVDVARFYYRETKKELSFVPLYIAPRLKKMVYGTPVRFDASAPAPQERERISRVLYDEITRIARSLPEHVVVPYPNLPKNEYPTNRTER